MEVSVLSWLLFLCLDANATIAIIDCNSKSAIIDCASKSTVIDIAGDISTDSISVDSGRGALTYHPLEVTGLGQKHLFAIVYSFS